MSIAILPTLKIKKIDNKLYQCIYVNTEEVLLPVVETEQMTEFRHHGQTLRVLQKPIKAMTAHVVLTSHHDIGYTDLSSEVIAKHVRSLCAAIEAADRDKEYRISIEQFWSLEAFLQSAPPAYVEKMIAHLKSGRFELGASYGNMITEVMEHAELYSYTKPSVEFARAHGFEVLSATHNDIPGFSYGLCRALCDSGVRMLVMGFPTYHAWGNVKLPAPWQLEKELGHALPGGLIWESDDGKKLLMWATEQYYATYPNRESIDAFLSTLYEGDYPYDVLRLPVLGGNQDNSPYTEGYCEFIRKWNEEYVSPKLVMSTNTKFYREFEKYISTLKTVRGDVPGTDYPLGYLSMPDTATEQGRNRHDFKSAKALAFMNERLTGEKPSAELMEKIERSVLRYDEHCTGFHFPAGPCAVASLHERKLYAYQSASRIYEMQQKAMARIADGIREKSEHPLLVVFNPTAHEVTAPVEASMRELDNSGQYLRLTSYGDLKIAQVADRFHYNPQGAFLKGRFKVVDDEGREVPFSLHTIEDICEPVLYAGQRLGLGGGTDRYGFFENPKGIKMLLRFVGEKIPPFGYRSYSLVPCRKKEKEKKNTQRVIENEFYRVELKDGLIGITDKTDGTELVSEGQIFGQLLVRTHDYKDKASAAWKHVRTELSAVHSRMYFKTKIVGMPAVTMCLTLWNGLKRLDVDYKIVRDEMPMLTTAIAFPFAGEDCAFSYDASLHIKKPAEDLLLGAYQDVCCAVGWVKQYERAGDRSVICASRESSVYTFSEFRDFYVSTAHRCYLDIDKVIHRPPTVEDFQKGGIYSVISCTNFGTNFLVSEPATFTLRYSFTTESGDAELSRLERFAECIKQPLTSIFKHPERVAELSLRESVAKLSGENMQLVDVADDAFLIWNKGDADGVAGITLGTEVYEKTIAAHAIETVRVKP